jgi:hypothetical protein
VINLAIFDNWGKNEPIALLTCIIHEGYAKKHVLPKSEKRGSSSRGNKKEMGINH